MRLILVRHAQPLSSTVASDDVCPSDEANVLSDSGMEQARMLAEELFKLCSASAPRIISSPVIRALQTAQAIAARLEHQKIEIDERLAERLKDWSGAPTVAAIQAEERAAFENPLVRTAFGESLIEHRSRVLRLFDELIVRAHDEHTVMLVCHGGTIEHMLGIVLGLDVSRMLNLCFALDNGCHHELSYLSAHTGGGEWTIQRMNVKPTP